jgi:RNA polymerase sigma-70 factor (ECF subfamily)
MVPSPEWDLDRYRSLLRVQVRQLQLDPRLRRRFGESDLVQEALLKAHRHRAQFRGGTEGELVRWLQQILANVVRDEVRRAHAQGCDINREVHLDGVLAESSARLDSWLAAEHSTPGEQAERNERVLRVTAALDRLPEDQRDVVLLRDLMGLSVRQTAEQLGRTEKSVAGLLLRGRRALRRMLEGETP